MGMFKLGEQIYHHFACRDRGMIEFQSRETAAGKPRPDLDAGDEILSKVENDE